MLDKLTAILSDFFEVGSNCYHYILERVKYAELTAKDFREYNEDDVAEIADHLIANGVTVQRWIPVTERLPDYGQEVIVYGGNYLKACITAIRFWDKEHVNWFGVTHWMPLPEPPKGE